MDNIERQLLEAIEIAKRMNYHAGVMLYDKMLTRYYNSLAF